MKEGKGTLKELTALWRQLDSRGKWLLVETAYGEVQNMKRHPECRSDMPSHAETMSRRAKLDEEYYGATGLERADSH